MNFLAFGKMNKNLVTLASGTTVAQFVPVIITPFLTRLYKPSEFGVFGVYFSIVTLLVIVACGRYEQAIVLPEEDNDARSLTLFCICLTFIFSIFIFIILISANKFYNISFDDQTWIWLLPFGVLLTSLYQVLNYWFTRQQVFKQISFSRIIQAISIVLSQSILGLFGFFESLDGLVFGYLIGVLLSNLHLLSFISKSNLSLADGLNLENLRKIGSQGDEYTNVNGVFAKWLRTQDTLRLDKTHNRRVQ